MTLAVEIKAAYDAVTLTPEYPDASVSALCEHIAARLIAAGAPDGAWDKEAIAIGVAMLRAEINEISGRLDPATVGAQLERANAMLEAYRAANVISESEPVVPTDDS